MLLAINDVFVINNNKVRLLYIDEGYSKVTLINIEKESPPFFMSMSDFINDSTRIEDPYDKPISPEEPPDKFIKIMESKWEVLSQVTAHLPEIYNKGYRNNIINKVVSDTKCNRRALKRDMYRYWQRGMSRFALLPDYSNVGKAVPIEGQQKPGRKRNIHKNPEIKADNGPFITASMLDTFKVYYKYFNSKANKVSWRYVYKLMLSEQFLDASSKPSFFQFRDRYDHYYSKEQTLRSSVGNKKFDKDYRHLTGNSTEDAKAVGNIYQIDATIADVYVVSKLDRRDALKRPTIYFAIDVFSRLIAGFYCGFTPPSQEAAMNLIINCTTDKVEFCRKYGVEINEEDWPSKHLPSIFLCDNGEMHGDRVAGIMDHFSVQFKYAGTNRGEMKGVVERSFHSFHETIKPNVPGFTLKDYRERRGRDYKKDAILTLDDLTTIIINYILYHNSKLLQTYPIVEKIAHGGVNLTPKDIWAYSVSKNDCRFMSFEKKVLRPALLQKKSCMPSRKGLTLHKELHYTSPVLQQDGLFLKNMKTKKQSVLLAYNPRNLREAYVYYKGEYHKAVPTINSNLSKYHEEEILEYNKSRRDIEENLKDEEIKKFSKLNDAINQTIKDAKHLAVKQARFGHANTDNIADNTRREKHLFDENGIYGEHAMNFDDPDILNSNDDDIGTSMDAEEFSKDSNVECKNIQKENKTLSLLDELMDEEERNEVGDDSEN